MKKNIKDRIELSVVSARHVMNNDDYNYIGNLEVDPMFMYLLERIEELESTLIKKTSEPVVKKLKKYIKEKDNKGE